MLLDIATSLHRKQKLWTNRQIAWSDLLVKLRRTTRTHETYAEYLAADPERQAEIKDVGGFVGGYLNKGIRRKGRTRHRQLLTLDLDELDGDFWSTFQMFFSEEAVIHSTHKHSNAKPRLRLIMPLSRSVNSEEYEALARKVAGNINIEWFDITTFQPERMMYWPSTSTDGDWLFEHQKGDWLNPDDVLSQYVDWADMSAWPRSAREAPRVEREGKKLGEPTEKPGVIGAFCRVFNIHDAISRFIPEAYIPSSGEENRYSYAHGSSTNGAVVYNHGKFIFSHHASDPLSQRAANAFDMVRVHKFGELDSDADREKPVSEHPSFKAMSDWALTLPEIIYELDEFKEPIEAALNLEGAPEPEPVKPKPAKKAPAKKAPAKKAPAKKADKTEAPAEAEPEEPEVPAEPGEDDYDGEEVDFREYFGLSEPPEAKGVDENNWQLKLKRKKNSGEIEEMISNLKLILIFDPHLRGKIALNEFENFIYLMGSVPWDSANTKPRRWRDGDDSGLREYMETKYGVYHVGKVQDAMVLAAVHNRYHPIRTYLDGLTWDGVPRLDTLFVDYLGAEDSPYVRAVTRKAFAAAVARVYRPGIKFDHVVTLVGPEGIKKSGILMEMGGAWFSDSFQTVTGKEAYEQLQGSWIIEIAELSAFNKAETNAIKAFVTKRFDRYRAAYGKHVMEWPRQSVFFATTNEPTFLKGHTGNRRFWPVPVTTRHEPAARLVNESDSDREVIVGLPVDQLWAEAKHYYKEGEPLYLNDRKIELMAKEKQDEYSEVDERVGVIARYMDTRVPKDWAKTDQEARRMYFSDPEEMRSKGEVRRDYICPLEVWCEALGMRMQDFNTAKGREIRAIMSMIPGWRYVNDQKTFAHYGRQRYFERINKDEPVTA